MDENIKIAKRIFGELNNEEKGMIDEYVGMALSSILLAKLLHEGKRQTNPDALTLYTRTCTERTVKAMERVEEKLTDEDQRHIEGKILQTCPSLFDKGPEASSSEPETDEQVDDAETRESSFVSCVVFAAVDLSPEDQEQVAQAIAMVAHHAIANKVTDAEGALELLGNVPKEVAEALGRFGAKVVDMLPASLRSQLDKQ